jgi:hypothetical protein
MGFHEHGAGFFAVFDDALVSRLLRLWASAANLLRLGGFFVCLHAVRYRTNAIASNTPCRLFLKRRPAVLRDTHMARFKKKTQHLSSPGVPGRIPAKRELPSAVSATDYFQTRTVEAGSAFYR